MSNALEGGSLVQVIDERPEGGEGGTCVAGRLAAVASRARRAFARPATSTHPSRSTYVLFLAAIPLRPAVVAVLLRTHTHIHTYTHTHIQYCTTTMTDVNATMGVKVRTANPPVSQTGCCCPNVSHGKFSMSDSGLIRECRPFLPRAGLDHPRNGPTILPSPARPADAPSRALAPSLRPHFAHRRTTTTQCCRSAWPRC